MITSAESLFICIATYMSCLSDDLPFMHATSSLHYNKLWICPEKTHSLTQPDTLVTCY